MIGENLLNISKINDARFKVVTDKHTYIYITLDRYNSTTNIKYFPDMIYPGEITEIKDDGNEFIIITDSGKNVIELAMYSFGYGYFMLVDLF